MSSKFELQLRMMGSAWGWWVSPQRKGQGVTSDIMIHPEVYMHVLTKCHPSNSCWDNSLKVTHVILMVELQEPSQDRHSHWDSLFMAVYEKCVEIFESGPKTDQSTDCAMLSVDTCC